MSKRWPAPKISYPIMIIPVDCILKSREGVVGVVRGQGLRRSHAPPRRGPSYVAVFISSQKTERARDGFFEAGAFRQAQLINPGALVVNSTFRWGAGNGSTGPGDDMMGPHNDTSSVCGQHSKKERLRMLAFFKRLPTPAHHPRHTTPGQRLLCHGLQLADARPSPPWDDIECTRAVTCT